MASLTSFTSPAASPTFTPPPLSSQRPDPVPQTPGGNGTSSSLYLYVFVATLVILLAISGTIVFRSMVIRRRRRAVILEAIANGTYIPTGPVSRNTERPRMWEVYLDPEKEYVKGEDVEKGSTWADIKPVSATVLDDPANPRPMFTLPLEPALFRLPAFLRRSRASPPLAPAPAPPAEPQPAHPVPVQLAVLVAMPGSASEQLPVLEFGVSVVQGHVREPPPPSS